MVICQKCKKEIPVWKSYPQKEGYSLCKDCRKDVKDSPKILDELRTESSLKQSKRIIKTEKNNLVIKVKKERRSVIATIILLLLGLSLIAIGIVVFIFSIPLMLIIVGFFSGAGSIAIFCLGAYIVAISVYQSKKIPCPSCGEIKKVNIQKAFTCERCQKRVLVEYS